MRQRPTAVDLFAGAGGATQGLRDAGYDVLGAVEIDPDAAASYRLNHPSVVMWEQDITRLPASAMLAALGLKPGELTLLKGCPPCQGFSSLAAGDVESDPRNDLVGHMIRFARALRPKAVLVENVPGLGRDRRATALADSLVSLGYRVRTYMVDARDFGVPQRRKRLIILAVRGGSAPLPERLAQGSWGEATVRAAFAELEDAVAIDDPLHTPRLRSPKVQERIAAIPIGGSRHDLPEMLQLDCHKRIPGRSAAAGSYGRMKWDEAAATMTTRCTTPACGPFIHPELDRSITLREAAAIQTFPPTYAFAGGYGSIERQIGNAVPVKMATEIARLVLATVS